MSEETTLADLLALNLHEVEEDVRNIVDKATKELSMEKTLKVCFRKCIYYSVKLCNMYDTWCLSHYKHSNLVSKISLCCGDFSLNSHTEIS